MNGRFPFDVFLITFFFPFATIAASISFVPLLVPFHVHHRWAVVVALVLAAGLVLNVLVLWIRGGATRDI